MFEFSDYQVWISHEKWFNYDEEHQWVRDFCKRVTSSQFGLVYNEDTGNYFMTLSRNHPNLTQDWEKTITENGGEYIGEAFCNALLVYFNPPKLT